MARMPTMRSLPTSRWFNILLCLLLLAIGFPSGCSQPVKPADFSGKTPLVRVLILQNQSRVTLTASEMPSIRLISDVSSRRVDLSPDSPVALTCSPQGWQLGSAPLGTGEFVLTPAAEGSVAVSGHAYRGRFRFIPRSNTTFDVVNDVDVEGYLKGLLARELFPTFADETYKAQAVVARTYALYIKQTHSPGSDYDLFSDDRDQVYGGLSAETTKAKDAVEATRGIVAAYGPPGQERIFKAYFSSCCGGRGQSAAEAFGDPVIPPLSAQAVGALCSESPRFNWPTITLSKVELTRRFKHFGQLHNLAEKDIATISRIDIMSINNVGRPVMFTITDNRNRRFAINGEELRRAVNTDATPGTKLYSSLLQPLNDPTQIRFTNGHGLGHGVGMCQWCAQRRAEMGLGYEQIVMLAYPESKLVKAY
jgi:stage II sporulation protein D